MTDIMDPQTRSALMARIKGRNTKPELIVQRSLHKSGFRFRLNVGKLPGSPDIVLPKWRIAIFVHGCFWHRHPGCRKATTPSTNADFWDNKFQANVHRDKRALAELASLNWRTAIIWECALTSKHAAGAIDQLVRWIQDCEVEHFVVGGLDTKTIKQPSH